MHRAIICLLLVVVCSCSVKRRLFVLATNHPKKAADFFLSFYPTKDSITEHTEYIEGLPVIVEGPVRYVDCDSVIARNKSSYSTKNGDLSTNKPAYSANTVRVDCPPSTLRVDTAIKTITITKTPTGIIQVYKDDADKWKEKAATRLKWMLLFGGGLLVIVGFAVFKVVKRFV